MNRKSRTVSTGESDVGTTVACSKCIKHQQLACLSFMSEVFLSGVWRRFCSDFGHPSNLPRKAETHSQISVIGCLGWEPDALKEGQSYHFWWGLAGALCQGWVGPSLEEKGEQPRCRGLASRDSGPAAGWSCRPWLPGGSWAEDPRQSGSGTLAKATDKKQTVRQETETSTANTHMVTETWTHW